MVWTNETTGLNEHYIQQDASIKIAGRLFDQAKIEEIAIVDNKMQPLALITKQDYIHYSLLENVDMPVLDCSLENSWVCINKKQTLPQLLFIKADYLVRVDGKGRFQAVIPKEQLVRQYIKELKNPLLFTGQGSLIVVVDSNGEKVYLDLYQASNLNDRFMDSFNQSSLWISLLNAATRGISRQGEELSWGDIDWTVFTLPVYEKEKLLGAVGLFYYSPEIHAVIKQIRHLEEMYKEVNTIIETSYDGFNVTDGQGVVLRVNRSHQRITGSRPENMVGKHILDCVKEGELSDSVTMEVLKHKRTVTAQQQVRNGKHIIVTGTPVFDEAGEIIRVVCNLRDITELKTLEGKLAETEKSSKQYRNELEHLRKQHLYHEQIITASEAMNKILDEVQQVADKDVTVIVLGETGVGKGVIAKEIHQSSIRRDGPFIDINCGAIPPALLESELFGYEHGAFTGAKKGGKPGIFELAQHGTLFLDEIGELPMDLQVKLLKVLQEKQILRVGGTAPIPVDVRIICATNRNLREMMANGDFRSDLYYRLFVVPIYIPALRYRKDDIIPLMNYYLDKFNQKYGCAKEMAPEVQKKMLHYSWPGNVRELENLVERLVVSVPVTTIDAGHIPELYMGEKSYWKDERGWGPGIVPLRQAVEEKEKYLIVQALKECGSMTKAAKRLGLDRTTVLRKVSKYSIPYQKIKKQHSGT